MQDELGKYREREKNHTNVSICNISFKYVTSKAVVFFFFDQTNKMLMFVLVKALINRNAQRVGLILQANFIQYKAEVNYNYATY